MRSFAFVFVVSLVGTAAAQPSPPPPVDSTGQPDVNPTPPPTPPPAPPPPPTPPPRIEQPVERDHDRPEALAVAIGVGYEFKTNLDTPNIVSVRFRLPSGLTFEPLFKVQNSSTDTQTQPNPTTSSSTTELAIGSLVRYPLAEHGKIDFELLGSLLVDTTKVNPDGPDNDTRTTTLALGWGLGIGYWITRHWELSFDAANPLFEYSKTSQQTSSTTQMTSATTEFGLVFDPTVALMIHLYN